MAYDATNEEFTQIFKEQSLTKELFKKLGAYIEKNRKTPEMQEMGRYLQNEERELSSFTCRQDVLKSLINNLTLNRIPFILVKNKNGEYGLIIKTSDEGNAALVIEDTLTKLSHYIEILNDEQFKASLVAENTADKNILYICGLKEDELENLISIIKEYYEIPENGMSVGIEKRQDGSFSLLLHAKSMMKKKKGCPTINLMCLLNTIQMNSPHKKEEVKNKIVISKMLGDDFKAEITDIASSVEGYKNDVGYILGGENQYVKLMKNKFEYGHVEVFNSVAFYNPDFIGNYKTDIPKLKETVNLMDRPFYTRDPDEAVAHLETKKSYTLQENGELQLAYKIDDAVCERIKYSPIMKEKGRWKGKFMAYSREAGSLLEDFSNGQAPSDIQRIGRDYKLTYQDYASAASVVKNTEVKEELAMITIKEISFEPDRNIRKASPIREDVDREEYR